MYQPVIIIGAPRSGTNMLRDVLTSLPGMGTWPCDEINYIWRCGNAREPLDELRPEQATPAIRNAIRRAFEQIASRQELGWVVEKTCANSLRVAFVDTIVPEAKYLFLIRDGRDVVASARRCWTSSPNFSYLARKARYVPLGDVPYYAAAYLLNRLYRRFSGQRRLAAWGPRFAGMKSMLAERSLSEVCTAQWARCVQKAHADLRRLDAGRVHVLRYEDFVTHPVAGLQSVVEFLGIEVDSARLHQAVRGVSDRSVAAGRGQLEQTTRERIWPLMQEPLERFYPEIMDSPAEAPVQPQSHSFNGNRLPKAA